MIRRPLTRLLGLGLALALAACAAYEAQHAPLPVSAAASLGNPDAALAAILPPPEGQLTRLHGEVDETREALAEQGKYACCVRPACGECLLRHGQCHCRHHIHRQGPCGECTQGWIEGRGTVEGIDARGLLERKLKSLDGTDQGHPNP